VPPCYLDYFTRFCATRGVTESDAVTLELLQDYQQQLYEFAPLLDQRRKEVVRGRVDLDLASERERLQPLLLPNRVEREIAFTIRGSQVDRPLPRTLQRERWPDSGNRERGR
jgi:hypothetical protein